MLMLLLWVEHPSLWCRNMRIQITGPTSLRTHEASRELFLLQRFFSVQTSLRSGVLLQRVSLWLIVNVLFINHRHLYLVKLIIKIKAESKHFNINYRTSLGSVLYTRTRQKDLSQSEGTMT